MSFYPEGMLAETYENEKYLSSVEKLLEAKRLGMILEARTALCDSGHNLIIPLPCADGIIPRSEGAIGISDGSTKDIALITKVNRPVCFTVKDVVRAEGCPPLAVLSRKSAQERCLEEYIRRLSPGDIIPARVTHMEQFGAFVDIGCGVPSLLPIDVISVSRIAHPADRFSVGQDIRVIIKEHSGDRILLSHKELLGTWEENAALFSVGETVRGTIRSAEPYGVFIELTPNLAGLAELRGGVRPGQCASVYIKAIIPEKMKIKLIIVDVFDSPAPRRELTYVYHDRHISSWRYSPESCPKLIGTVYDDEKFDIFSKN